MTAAATAAIGAYLLGSIPSGVWLARGVAGADPLREGSRSTGATNVARVAGWRAGVAALALDVGKGIAAVLLARRLAGETGAALAAVAVVIGHVVPPWYRGRGGKGVATAAGALGALAPLPITVALATFGAVVLASRYVSVASLAAAAAFPAAALLLGSSRPVVAAGLIVAAIVLARHRDNLSRLRAGAEPRIGSAARGAGA